jgi:hypothetical protein
VPRRACGALNLNVHLHALVLDGVSSVIDRQAPAQRGGVLAALNMVADSSKLLPRELDTARALRHHRSSSWS